MLETALFVGVVGGLSLYAPRYCWTFLTVAIVVVLAISYRDFLFDLIVDMPRALSVAFGKVH